MYRFSQRGERVDMGELSRRTPLAAGGTLLAAPALTAGVANAAGLAADTEANGLNWRSFLAGSDLVWQHLPRNWYEGPLLGNGFLGASSYAEPGFNAIRFTVQHSVVQDHRPEFGSLHGRARLQIGWFTPGTGGHDHRHRRQHRPPCDRPQRTVDAHRARPTLRRRGEVPLGVPPGRRRGTARTLYATVASSNPDKTAGAHRRPARPEVACDAGRADAVSVRRQRFHDRCGPAVRHVPPALLTHVVGPSAVPGELGAAGEPGPDPDLGRPLDQLQGRGAGLQPHRRGLVRGADAARQRLRPSASATCCGSTCCPTPCARRPAR